MPVREGKVPMENDPVNRQCGNQYEESPHLICSLARGHKGQHCGQLEGSRDAFFIWDDEQIMVERLHKLQERVAEAERECDELREATHSYAQLLNDAEAKAQVEIERLRSGWEAEQLRHDLLHQQLASVKPLLERD